MTEESALSIVSEKFSLVPHNLTEAMEYAKLIASSSLVPKSYRDDQGKVNPGDILVAVQTGLEVGLKPLQAIQNIAVINGQPTIWGDGMRALVVASGECEYLKDTWDAAKQVAVVVGKRKGKPERTVTFSWADAERAGLAQKETYKKYPQRMCKWRAVAWFCRDEFPDVLKGLQCREEVDDYAHVGTTDEGVDLLRPRSKSGESVDAFLKDAGEAKPAANGGASHERPKQPVDRSKLVRVLVKSARSAQGGGKTFYPILCEFSSGKTVEASTFSETDFETAKKLVNNFALIETKDVDRGGGKKYTNLTYIEAAPAETAPPPSDEGEPGGAG